MIISKSPFRISFFGGSTDYEEWFTNNGGAFISLAFQKYSYSVVKRLPKNSDKKYHVQWRIKEATNDLNNIISIAKENDLYLFSDEIYRLMERDKIKRLEQISDLYEKGLSLNGMSKAYGMPGIRMGWISSKDHSLLDKMEKLKHYLSICNSSPNEVLTIIALKYRSQIIERTRSIIKNNLNILNGFFRDYDNIFDWKEPDGGCIGFPKYKGLEGSDVFCKKLVESRSVLLLPSSVYNSQLMPAPENHFRIGYGRSNMPEALSELKKFIDRI